MGFDEPVIPRAADKYEVLIRCFVDGRISAPDFKTAFLAKFKTDPDHFPVMDFDVLEKLFTDVDAYVADPDLRGLLRAKDPEFLKYAPAYDEQELWACALEAHRKLYPK